MITSSMQWIVDASARFASAAPQFIYDYQTLITGFLAIGAAYYAGAPVWRQLRDSNLQTRIMHRDTLATRLHEAQERAAKVAKAIDEPLSQLDRLTSDPAGESIEIGEHDAFHMDQIITGCLDWYLVTLRNTEDARIEEAKSALKAALDSLTQTLNFVHWPAHNDQTGEDYALSDTEWAEVLERARESKVSAAGKVSAAWKANHALKTAQQEWMGELRLQIARLDLGIAKAN